MRRQALGAPNAVSPTCSRVHFSLFTLMQHLPELYRFIELKSFSLSHALHLIHRKMVNFQNKNTEKDIYAVQELKLIYVYKYIHVPDVSASRYLQDCAKEPVTILHWSPAPSQNRTLAASASYSAAAWIAWKHCMHEWKKKSSWWMS